MSIWEIIGAILVFLFGLGVAKVISVFFKTNFSRIISLYLWHTSFCLLYAWYTTEYGGDSPGYYNASLNGNIMFSFGTDAVRYLTMFFSNILRLSFLATSLAYNIFGFVGMAAFDAAIRLAVLKKKKNIRRLATLIIFLPSLTFWTSGLGKDSLAFMSAGLVLWAALDFNKRAWLMLPAVIIMLLVRPHIAGLLIMSFAVSIIMQKRGSPIFKVFISVIAIMAATVLIPIGLKYSSFDSATGSEGLQKYVDQRAKYNMEGGGGVNISNMPLPLQVLTYLFRPLPFEAHNFGSFASSLDNMILIYLFIVGIKSMLKTRYVSRGENRVFMWTYSFMSLLLLSTTTANLGISVRQKWMFTPMFIFLMISVIGNRDRRKQNSKKQSSLSINSLAMQIPENVQLSRATSRTGSIPDL